MVSHYMIEHTVNRLRERTRIKFIPTPDGQPLLPDFRTKLLSSKITQTQGYLYPYQMLLPSMLLSPRSFMRLVLRNSVKLFRRIRNLSKVWRWMALQMS